ncbi:MAG: hypothetical protein K9M99_11970 [Candidatus Cloacimonetes bacterium]|nr:hypothetical protein [Candidatus Cloacimonadota bacterium]
MIEKFIRTYFSRIFTGENQIALENNIPSNQELSHKFQELDEIGLYLHIPFCQQICPYCPYNKEVYDPLQAKK